MKRFLIIVVIIGVIAAGYFGYTRFFAPQTSIVDSYQTVELTKGDLTAVVGATGTVRTDQTAIISWQTSGRVEAVHFSLGEEISADEVFAELARDSLSQSIILAEAELIDAENVLENLLDNEAARAQAQLTLVTAQDALEDALDRRESKDYQRASDATLDSARASLTLAENNVEQAQELYNMFSDRDDTDVDKASALSRLSAAKLERDRALAQLNWLLGKPDELEISLADANVAVAQANLVTAQQEWERIKDGPDPDDIRKAEVRIESIQATLALSMLKSPFAGTITDINIKVGDLVSPGALAFRVDDMSSLVVDVQIPEVDINRIEMGQTVRLIFDAATDKEYTGTVIEVGSIGNDLQGAVEFTVTIELIDFDEDVQPGMTAAANIVVNQLSDVLLVPNRAVKYVDGARVVYVLDGETLHMVEIEIGATSDLYSEIIAGDVKEGDLVVLNPPSQIDFTDGPPSFVR